MTILMREIKAHHVAMNVLIGHVCDYGHGILVVTKHVLISHGCDYGHGR